VTLCEIRKLRPQKPLKYFANTIPGNKKSSNMHKKAAERANTKKRPILILKKSE
jgi:hydrogenase maturation factor HypF (carbamoyltransferase family)